MNRHWSIALFVCLLAGLSASLRAQSLTTAEIDGVVSDPSGAAVPDAAVTAVSLDRGSQYGTKTNGQGYYVLSHLLAGRYRLEVQKPGFAAYLQTGIVAVAAVRARLDVALTTESLNQSVSVVGDVPLLNTTNNEVGQTVDTRRIGSLPMISRSYQGVLNLGVNTRTFDLDTRSGVGTVLGGTKYNAVSISIDGVDNNTIYFNRDSVRPSLEGIQEVRVLSSSPSAEYGRNLGAVVSILTKSGTNEYHGSLFEYHRNQHLNARNAFSAVASPFYVQNQFGGSLGGAIRKNKLFFFGTYEGARVWSSNAANVTVPATALRSGDFRNAAPIFDPVSTRPSGNGYVRSPFPGNQIPVSSMDPVGQKIAMQAWPIANIGATTYRTQAPNGSNYDQYSGRGDYYVTERDRLAFRYTYSPSSTKPTNVLPKAFDGNAPSQQYPHNAMIEYVRNLSPNTLNEFRAGFNRIRVRQVPLNFGTDPAGNIGLMGTSPSKEFSSFPSIQTGYTDLGSGSNFLLSSENIFEWSDNLTSVRGRHTWKAGLDVRRLQDAVFGSFVPFGQIRFGSIFSSNPGVANTGDAIADLLLGYPQSIQLDTQFNPIYGRQWLLGSFVQDEFRVNSHLTLNLGVRYELFTPTVDKYDRQSNPNIANPLGEFRLATADGQISQSVQNDIGLLPFSPEDRARLFQPGSSRALTRTNKLDFSPRFGFAYQVQPNLVVRGGFGVYRSITGGGTFVRLGFNPPNFIETFLIVPDSVTPVARLSTGIPSYSSGQISGLAPRHRFEDDRTQTSLQWNLSVEKVLPKDVKLEVGYAGARGRNLTLFLLENQIQNPADYGKGQNARPVPYFGNIWGWGGGAISNYHAGTIEVTKRYSYGLTGTLGYTFSKSLDNSPGDFAAGYLGISTAPIDSYDISREYGPSTFDTTHRVISSWVYEIPVGKGRHWRPSPLVNAFLGGWNLAGIVTWQTGFPVDARTQSTRVFSFNNQNRPDRIKDGSLPSDERSAARWFDTTAFTNPADYQLGNSGRNVLRAPGLVNLDGTISKSFALRERTALEFRAEFYNALNNVNLGPPNDFLGNPNFGQITSSRAARQIQFALRASF